MLAASDTQGAVHLYTPEKIVAHDGGGQPVKRQGRELVELAHHPLYDEYRRKMSPLDAASQSLTPLVRVGEQNYPSAVVCCSFPPSYPNEDLPASPLSSPLNSPSSKSQSGTGAPSRTRLGKWDPAAMVQRNGPLLVGVAHGELYVYDSADLASLSTGQSKPPELEFTLEDGRRRTASGTHFLDDHSEGSVDSAVEASDRKTITRKNSMREQQQANATLAAAAKAGGSDSDNSSQDGWENLKIAPKHVRYTAPEEAVSAQRALPAKPPRTKSNAAAAAAAAVVVEEECSEYPRTIPPPAPVPAARAAPQSVSSGTRKLTLNADGSKVNGRVGSRPMHEQRGAASSPIHIDSTDVSIADTTSTPSSPMSTLPSPPKFLQNRIATKTQEAPRVNSLAVPVETFSKVNDYPLLLF